MLNAIATNIKEMVGHDYLYFDTPLQVKLSPHTRPQNYWAACVSPNGDVFVMDVEEEWHQLEHREEDAQVMETLFQRVRFLKQQYRAKQREEAL